MLNDTDLANANRSRVPVVSTANKDSIDAASKLARPLEELEEDNEYFVLGYN